MAPLFRNTKDGHLISVRLIPGASRDEILTREKFGSETVLKVKVRAIPEKGKANRALCLLLAKSFKLPKSNFEVISGVKSRTKTVLIRDLDEEKLKTLASAFE